MSGKAWLSQQVLLLIFLAVSHRGLKWWREDLAMLQLSLKELKNM